MYGGILRKIEKARKLGLAESSAVAIRRLKKKFHVLPEVPPTVYIELTDICNLDCIMCDRASMSRGSGLMSMDLFKKIIDEAAEIGVPEVKLNRFGEPMIHPNLIDMIHYAKNKGIPRVYFTSNATLLDEKKCEALIHSGLDSLTFSVDGSTAETYERIRINAKFKEVTTNIRRFIEMRNAAGQEKPHVVINTVYMAETKDEVLQVFDQWGKHVHRINVLPVAQYGNVDNHAPIDKAGQEKRPCHQPFDRLMIFWDGLATVCCADINGDLTVGSALESKVGELWCNDEFSKLRKAHLAKDFSEYSICASCDGTNKKYLEKMSRIREDVYNKAHALGY